MKIYWLRLLALIGIGVTWGFVASMLELYIVVNILVAVMIGFVFGLVKPIFWYE